MVARVCENKHCRAVFQARQVDVNRGWGRFCSKSCKAVEQESRIHQYKELKKFTNIPSTSPDLLDLIERKERRNRVSMVRDEDNFGYDVDYGSFDLDSFEENK